MSQRCVSFDVALIYICSCFSHSFLSKKQLPVANLLSDPPLLIPTLHLDNSNQEDPHDLISLPPASWSFLNDSHVFHGVFDKSSSKDDF